MLSLHKFTGYILYTIYSIEADRLICIYIYNILNCLCGSVAKASGTQAVGHGFDPRPDH